MHENEPPGERRPSRDDRIGLCAKCRYARRIVSSRGADFWHCRRAADDPSYPRYPRLPVIACNGFDPNEARTAPSQGESGG
jgi:hypothetical protein